MSVVTYAPIEQGIRAVQWGDTNRDEVMEFFLATCPEVTYDPANGVIVGKQLNGTYVTMNRGDWIASGYWYQGRVFTDAEFKDIFTEVLVRGVSFESHGIRAEAVKCKQDADAAVSDWGAGLEQINGTFTETLKFRIPSS